MQERADQHARDRAFDIARKDPHAGFSTEEALVEVCDLLEPIGAICPEYPEHVD